MERSRDLGIQGIFKKTTIMPGSDPASRDAGTVCLRWYHVDSGSHHHGHPGLDPGSGPGGTPGSRVNKERHLRWCLVDAGA